jgi:hypothetical protein
VCMRLGGGLSICLCICLCVCLYVCLFMSAVFGVCLSACMYVSVCAWIRVGASMVVWKLIRMCTAYFESALFLSPETRRGTLTTRYKVNNNFFPNQATVWNCCFKILLSTARCITWSYHQALINSDTVKPP